MQRFRTLPLLAVLSGLLLVPMFSSSARAQGQEAGLRGRLWVGAAGRYVLHDNDPFDSPGFGTVELRVDGSALGAGGDLEYRLNRWLGVDAAVAYAKFDVAFTSSNSPGLASTHSFGAMPLLLALNVHVISVRRLDVWLGPQIGYVMFPDDLSYPVNGGGTFSYKPKGTFSKKGFVIGTDIGLTKTLAINSAFRWQDADGDDNGNLTIDPAFVTIGLTKRF